MSGKEIRALEDQVKQLKHEVNVKDKAMASAAGETQGLRDQMAV